MVRKDLAIYIVSEVVGSGSSLLATSISADLAKQASDSDLVSTGTAAAFGTGVFILGKVGTYYFLHNSNYENGSRNLIQDYRNIQRSTLKSLLIDIPVRAVVQFPLQHFFSVPARIAAPLASVVSGSIATLYRWNSDRITAKERKEQENDLVYLGNETEV